MHGPVHFAFLADEPLPDQRDAAPVAPTRSGIGNLGSYERGATGRDAREDARGGGSWNRDAGFASSEDGDSMIVMSRGLGIVKGGGGPHAAM